MKKRILNFLVTSILLVNISFCQKIVPVFQEPRHNPVLFNKYLRVIEAQIENGDSSLFHVHAQPSAFLFLTDAVYDNQVLNQPWTKATSKKGHAWYSSFADGPSTHRIAAPSDGRLHAYDIEILGKWAIVDRPDWKPMALDTIFISDKCVGYRLELTDKNNSFSFSGRGPTIAILVSGELVQISQPDTRVEIGIEEADYGYVRPGYGCTIRLTEGEKASLVLFEVR
jgi:hypothetical protein